MASHSTSAWTRTVLGRLCLVLFCWPAVPSTFAGGASIETPEERGISSLKAANAATDTADFPRALVLYDQALATFRSAGLEDRQGEAILGKGFVYYNMGQLDRAEQAAREALKKVSRYLDRLWSAAANAHRLLGNIHSDRSDHAAALAEFQTAREMAIAHGSRNLAAHSECEIGFVYGSMGDYRRAIEHADRALDEGAAIRRTGVQLDALILLGNLYLQLNDFRKARSYFERGLDLASKEDGSFAVAVIYDGLAYLYNSLGDSERSMAIRLESLRLAETVDSDKLRGQVYASIGHEYFLHDDLARADRYLLDAERFSKSCKDEWNLIWVYQDLCRLRSKEGLHAEAIRAGEEATRLSHSRNEIEETWSSLYLLGEALRAQGNDAGALQKFDAAIEKIESGRTAIQQSAQRSFYMTNKQALYEGAVSILAATGRDAEALIVSEKFRARTFLETLMHPSLAVRADLAGDPSRQDIFFPSFAGVDQIRRDLLLPGDVFLEYLVGEKRVYGFAITPDLLIVKDLGDSTALTRMATRYLDFLSHEEAEFGGKPGATRLFQILVEPLLDGMREPPRRLIISPDAILHVVPFETLIGRAGRYLIEDCTVTYASSGTILSKLNDRRLPLEQLRLVAVADPEGGAGEIGGERLRYSLEEIREIGAFFGDRRVLLHGSDATRERFFSQDLSRPTVFHFATHAVIDETDPLRSRIIMYTAGEDGDLGFNDIMGKRWASPLAVLSACGSGRGRVLSGEGLDGFARSFFYSGVNCLVLTLWNVEDESSFLLMRDFYAELAKGAAIDDALRAAKLKRLGEHPAHWAGFVCTGLSGQRVFAREATRGPVRWMWLLMSGIVFVSSAWLLFHRRRPGAGE